MEPWTIFWIAVLLMIVWTLRGFIAAGIIAVVVFCGAGVVLVGSFVVACLDSFSDWRHRRKYKL